MPIETEFFPHFEEHLSNDVPSSHVTMLLLALFALFATAVVITGLSAL